MSTRPAPPPRRPASVATSGSASGLPAPRPRLGAPGWRSSAGPGPGPQAPSLNSGSSWGLPAGLVGAGRSGVQKAIARRVPRSPLARRSLQENRSVTQAVNTKGRDRVISFANHRPLLLLPPSHPNPHPVLTAIQPRTRFHARV